MPSITSERTIDTLRSVFARYGLPQIIVTDNGSQFTSAEFQEFVHMNGIKHKRSAPYHPSTNGQAERFVQTLKQSMRASRSDGGSAQAKLDRFLLAYRNAAHSVTGESPASLFMKRQLRMRLDNLRPNIERRYAEQLHYQASLRDKRSKAIKMREFAVGQSILARDYTGKRKWVPGVVVEREGPLMYKITCKYKDSEWRDQLFYVVDVSGPVIIGLPMCSELHVVTIHEMHPQSRSPTNRPSPLKSVKDLQVLYPEQFDRIGNFRGEATLHVKEGAVPTIDAPRKCNVHVKDKLKAELDSMEKQGIIRQNDHHTDWCSSITTVLKKDGSLRVCLDPRRLNQNLKRCPHKIPTLEEVNPAFSGANCRVDTVCTYSHQLSSMLHPGQNYPGTPRIVAGMIRGSPVDP
ncbi:uncharacterized protein [Diadema antillarum]|uniref:uncharacterized protein n=1 Tax=Diadema antillarum TaxID=105358 RepID=UPI003A865A50